MQVIKFFDGSERILPSDEAENVKTFWLESSDRPIRLRGGMVINPKSISSIGEADMIPVWHGYPLDKSGKSFVRCGERIYLEPQNFKEIEYRLHPKYSEVVGDVIEFQITGGDKKLSVYEE